MSRSQRSLVVALSTTLVAGGIAGFTFSQRRRRRRVAITQTSRTTSSNKTLTEGIHHATPVCSCMYQLAAATTVCSCMHQLAAALVQTKWREYVSRKKARRTLEDWRRTRQELQEMANIAANRIQRKWLSSRKSHRETVARKRIERFLGMSVRRWKVERSNRRQDAALSIQRLFKNCVETKKKSKALARIERGLQPMIHRWKYKHERRKNGAARVIQVQWGLVKRRREKESSWRLIQSRLRPYVDSWRQKREEKIRRIKETKDREASWLEIQRQYAEFSVKSRLQTSLKTAMYVSRQFEEARRSSARDSFRDKTRRFSIKDQQRAVVADKLRKLCYQFSFLGANASLAEKDKDTLEVSMSTEAMSFSSSEEGSYALTDGYNSELDPEDHDTCLFSVPSLLDEVWV